MIEFLIILLIDTNNKQQTNQKSIKIQPNEMSRLLNRNKYAYEYDMAMIEE